MSVKTKILIVDDSEEILSAVRLFLEMKEFEVCSLVSYSLFKNTLAYFKPDLILLDIMLGSEPNGRVICKMTKSDPAFQNIPIVLMSSDPDRLINFNECHADDVIEKPFNIKALEEKITSAIRSKSIAVV
ncbi:MAG: hypothetical protein NVSMB45_02020 [Ginsengibacter sp.]